MRVLPRVSQAHTKWKGESTRAHQRSRTQMVRKKDSGIEHRTESSTHLVGVLDENILAIRLFHEEIRDCSHDAPAIPERDVQLGGEIRGPN